MELAKAIKLIRIAGGIKQKDAAARLGVTPNYLSLVENGKREPSISFLKRLASVLGVPVGLFFLWDPENEAGSTKNIDQIRNLLANLEAMRLFATRGKSRRGRAAA